MAKQLLIDATRGKQTEIPPWLPYAGVHCAALIGQPADVFLKDAELLAERGVAFAEVTPRGRQSCGRSFLKQ